MAEEELMLQSQRTSPSVRSLISPSDPQTCQTCVGISLWGSRLSYSSQVQALCFW